uniref:F-box domain-containing protein n=1 Tax=Psilocybe cubensis TaxID=181762 RepID=A0A8H7Y794_PSICU
MTKRSLSPAHLPPAKRVHTSGKTKHHPGNVLSFENSLYDELILCIFSHLTWVDLCVTQSTSKNWARLAADNELWREQYLKVYGRTRLRGARGFIGRLDGRDVKPLPGRAVVDPNQNRDWKWMFRISSNWRNGRCLVEKSSTNVSEHPNDPPKIYPEGTHEQTHIILAGTMIIFASSEPTSHPSVILSSQTTSRYVIPYYDQQDSHRLPVCITALALDQSPPTTGHLSLACFVSTGEFTVFDFNPSSPSHTVSKKFVYQPARRTARTMNIMQAAYYHPLLVTVSTIFSLSIYDLSSGVVRHTQTLSTFTSYPPVSLVLSSPSPGNFKLVITYSVPVYPRHWSVGATELIISNHSETASASGRTTPTVFSSPSFREDYKYPLTSTMSVITSRTIRAFDMPSSWVNDSTLRAMREQWGRKLLNVADAQTDGKWVVLAPGTSVYPIYGHQRIPSFHSSLDSSSSASSASALHSPTSLQLYRLVLPIQSNSIAASPPKLNFVRTLHGQTSPVSSLALSDGRCVSLGQNGSIWVWDLEAGTGAEVAGADEAAAQLMLPLTKGTVSFDDRRIVTAHKGKLVIRRFDI